jgi:radical SAM protein with 4Fe4S-binding SPASM domain
MIAGSMYKVRLRARWWARSRGSRTYPAFRVRYRFAPDTGTAGSSGVNPGVVASDCPTGWVDIESVVEVPSEPDVYGVRLELLLEGDFALFAGERRVGVAAHSDAIVAAHLPAVDVTMDITQKCPLRCIQCRKTYDETLDMQQDMDFDLFKKIAAEVFPHARLVMLSSAGEPLMSRHFMDAIEMTRSHPVQEIGFTSSGAHLNPRRAEQIVDLGVGRAEFSVDGATAAVYNGIRVGSDFDRVIGNLRHLAAYKQQKRTRLPIMRLNFVMMRRNIHELAPLVDLAADLGAEEVLCQHMIVFNDATRTESLLLDKERSNQALAEAKRRAERRGIRFYHPPLFALEEVAGLGDRARGDATPAKHDPYYAVEGDHSFERAIHPHASAGQPRCTDPWRKISFDWQGMVYPCCMWKEEPIGDMRRQTFEEVWNSDAYRRLRETLVTGPLMKSCAECSAITGGDVNNEAAFFF